MSLQNTPSANRTHITLFGRRNSGKSSLINAITGQQVALVSDIAGTTTDPVSKPMEMHGIGPCVFIDTAGFDDEGKLGELRIKQTLKTVDRTDIAIFVCNENDADEVSQWYKLIKDRNIPTLFVLNKADIVTDLDNNLEKIKTIFGQNAVPVSALTGYGIEELRKALVEIADTKLNNKNADITGNLVQEGDTVLLVMPQDIQAPKGRLILPQVQTIRELLDKKCMVLSCTTDKLQQMLQAMKEAPKLIITDSQVFRTVYELKPSESRITSFSVLFAKQKGDIEYFVEGANHIGSLNNNSRVLIAEACTHAPLTEDIGREKIPAMLRKRFGEDIKIDIVSGSDFPEDLSRYNLIIHCGGCMFNRKHVLSRVERAKLQNIPMTNYGVTIAYLQGILDKIEY